MGLSFERAQNLYKQDKVAELAATQDGLRFLLLKSLDRPAYEERMAQAAGLPIDQVRGRVRLKNLYASTLTVNQIRRCIADIYDEERRTRRENEKSLVAELYKMKSFDWGGLHQNALEKTIVDNYIKKIAAFDELNHAIDNEIFQSMRGYVQCSWYNHWTSILIEDIFKEQNGVTPAVGLIRKVDFFIGNQPFDLKVTYLPEGFIRDQRRARGLRPELTLLKQAARHSNVPIDNTISGSQLLEHLWTMLTDSPDAATRNTVAELAKFRRTVIDEVKTSPDDMIRWLYENQGVRRFDASNRLFLVLVNSRNYFDSWKLKRAHNLLADQVEAFLSRRGRRKVGREIRFNWQGQSYTAVSELLLIEHEA